MNVDELACLIEENRDDAVDFGDSSCELVPSQDRITEIEKILGINFPPSYLWFLKNYGGGEVYGEEIFSIYDLDAIGPGGDVAEKTISNRANNFVSNTDIVICYSMFGEIFTMDTTCKYEDGEYPVFIQSGNTKKIYANSFAEFLYKRISNPES